MASNALPFYASINEVAAYYGLSPWSIRQLVLEGRIPYIMSRSKYMVNTKGLSDYLAEEERKNMRLDKADRLEEGVTDNE